MSMSGFRNMSKIFFFFGGGEGRREVITWLSFTIWCGLIIGVLISSLIEEWFER